MSYQRKIEEMVGKNATDFQDELSLAKTMQRLTSEKPRMPFGYPTSVYYPKHFCKVPQVNLFITDTGGRWSNGVPKVIGAEIVDGYLLAVYNRRDH